MSHLQPPERRGTAATPTRTGSASAGTVSATVTALTADRALAALAQAGFDREVEARRAGVPEVADPAFEWRVPLAAVERLFERGIELCGPDFPLQARTPRAEDNRSPVNLYCRTRRSVREGFRAFAELFALVSDGYTLRLDEDPGGAWLTWCGAPRPAVWWFDAADMLASVRTAVAAGPWVTGVRAPFPAPPGAEVLFGCRCEPGPAFSVRIPEAVLAVGLPAPDPAVRAHIERQVAAMRPASPSSPGIVAALWSLGPTGTVSHLASLVGLSERTLHRRLADAGTSFRAELDAVRAHYARGAAGTRTAEELAVLLGYSDVRAYRRAARRWTADRSG